MSHVDRPAPIRAHGYVSKIRASGTSSLLHMAWTGIAAAALFATAATRRRREIPQFVGAFAVAVVLHTLWDSQTSLIGTAVVAVASLAILGFTAHRAARATIRA
jgi:RsiW-degrading membrane proteinase PrsW (M82 family)